MIEEIYKDIAGYEGYYKISNFGNVKSLERTKIGNGGSIQTVKEKIRKPVKDKGYQYVILYKDGKLKKYLIHRLVASAFIDNPDNLPEVNHKDEDKTNNKVDNLEWCSRKYNMNYGTRTERTSKQVAQIDKNTGDIIKIWKSTQECGRQGYNQGNIASCCRGELKSACGYYWKYIDNTAT